MERLPTGPGAGADPTAVRRFYEDYWKEVESSPEMIDPDTPTRWAYIDRSLEGRAPLAALDVGCGNGALVGHLGSLGHDCAGMELSQRAIDEARLRYPGRRFDVHSADEAPWPHASSSLDLVVSFEVLEHLFNPGVMLAEAFRVLKPGGRITVSTPYHGLVKNLLLATIYFDSHFAVNGGHIRFFSRKSLQAELARAGFGEISVSRYGRTRTVARGMLATAVKPPIPGQIAASSSGATRRGAPAGE